MTDTNPTPDGQRWEFYDSWAAFPLERLRNTDSLVVGEFYVSAPGTGSGFFIRFFEFHRNEDWRPTEVHCQLVAFGDAWRAMVANAGLLAALATLGDSDTGRGPDEVRTALLAIGMTDITAKLRGTHRSVCPTCSGAGQLDEIGTEVTAG